MTSYGASTRRSAPTGLLRDFNAAGVLRAADVHVAQRLGALGGETDEGVLLAVALVVRSTRHGSVVLDLLTAPRRPRAATTTRTTTRGEPAIALQWPDGLGRRGARRARSSVARCGWSARGCG